MPWTYDKSIPQDHTDQQWWWREGLLPNDEIVKRERRLCKYLSRQGVVLKKMYVRVPEEAITKPHALYAYTQRPANTDTMNATGENHERHGYENEDAPKEGMGDINPQEWCTVRTNHRLGSDQPECGRSERLQQQVYRG
jgi:hypothetical protein